MPEARVPSYVIVGHVTLDIVPGGTVPGGTATYAGKMASNLGEHVGVVTAAAPEFDFASALPGVQVRNVVSTHTSTFENIYVGGERQQFIRAVAEPLDDASVPTEWRGADILHLAPLTNEVMPGVEAAFPTSLRAATPQGWLRRWGADGLVQTEGWDSVLGRLGALDAVILSEEDVHRDEATIDLLRRHVPLLVVTRSSRGGTLFRQGEPWQYPAFPANEVDPTGAGDAFAPAFLIELRRTRDAEQACLFASCAASFVVEAPGAGGVPTEEQVRRRLGERSRA